LSYHIQQWRAESLPRRLTRRRWREPHEFCPAFPTDWSPDGKFVLFRSNASTTTRSDDVMTIPYS
jgi:hypothetical protein